MLNGQRLGLLPLALSTLAACGTKDETRAHLDVARRDLQMARSFRAAEFAPDSLRHAEEAFRTAELDARRQAERLNPLADRAPLDAKIQRAIQSARLAAWVAERNLSLAQADAEGFIWAASSRIEEARQNAGRLSLPLSIHAQLRKAELAMRQANYLLERSEFRGASRRARDAYELAGGAHGESERLVARFRSEQEVERWRDWIEEAVIHSRRSGRPALVVNKAAHQAVLYVAGKPNRRFDVDLGYGSVHQKLSAGDGATPEGRFRVVRKKSRGETIYYKALLLDYPTAADLARFHSAKLNGALANETRVGGLIEIHGDGGREKDWTQGCVALKNQDLDYLYARLAVGSPVVIVGSCGESARDRCP